MCRCIHGTGESGGVFEGYEVAKPCSRASSEAGEKEQGASCMDMRRRLGVSGQSDYGQTLTKQLSQMERVTGMVLEEVFVDRGCRV